MGNIPDLLMTHPAQSWVSWVWQHMAIPLCKTPPGNGKEFGLVFAKPHLPLHGDTATVWHLDPFCHWVFPTGDAGLWTGQEPPSHIPMAHAIAGALLGVDPWQLPLEAGYPALPWLSNSFENLKLTERKKRGRGTGMLLYQAPSLRDKPIATAASTQLQFQLDLYLPTGSTTHRDIKWPNSLTAHTDTADFAEEGLRGQWGISA